MPLEDLDIIADIYPNIIVRTSLSERRDITEEYIIKHRDIIRFDWITSYNKNISWNFIEENINEDWNWKRYTGRNDFPIHLLLNHNFPTKIEINCNAISDKYDIPFQEVYEVINRHHDICRECKCYKNMSMRDDID